MVDFKQNSLLTHKLRQEIIKFLSVHLRLLTGPPSRNSPQNVVREILHLLLHLYASAERLWWSGKDQSASSLSSIEGILIQMLSIMDSNQSSTAPSTPPDGDSVPERPLKRRRGIRRILCYTVDQSATRIVDEPTSYPLLHLMGCPS